jgi:hypothetical protein
MLQTTRVLDRVVSVLSPYYTPGAYQELAVRHCSMPCTVAVMASLRGQRCAVQLTYTPALIYPKLFEHNRT